MISKLFSNFHKSRFASKLIITYIILTVIPMAFLGFISYHHYTKSIEAQAGEFFPQLLKQANMNIDKQIMELQKLNELLYSSSSVMSILRNEEYPNQSTLLRDKFEMNTYLSNAYLSGIHYDIIAVFIQSNNRLFHHSRVDIVSEAQLEHVPSYGQHQVTPFFETDLRFEGDIPFLLIEREIIDFDNQKSLGTMFIALDLQFIDQVVEEMRDGGDIWLMDQDYRILYHSDQSRIGERFNDVEQLPVQHGSFKTLTNDDNKVISVSTSDEHQWILTHSIPAKHLTDRTDFVRNMTIIIFIAFVVVFVIISILLAWNVSRPIHRLSLLMGAVERGDFDIDIPKHPKSQDEVAVLTRSFHSMVTRIKELIRSNYQTALRQKEAELYALQFQINPHFMYNTLETISMMVEEDDKETVVEVVSILGKMLRYSLSNKDEAVLIATEVDHIRDFLTIQKYRFEDRLSFSIEQNIDGQQYFTPKFILQPIVENAVKYTIEDKEEAMVHVSVEKVDDEIVCLVRDNGPGIAPEKLIELEKQLKAELMLKKDSSFGLKNVHARIVMMYGESYGLRIHSEVGGGTEIIIRLPIMRYLGEGGSVE
ncbi:cache domain-containing sensor histidine kinase [Halalkalibacter hemicellulosilyticus]|nr:sensor histidine kinase [Halalkalibacter hemicellulosilyticus]